MCTGALPSRSTVARADWFGARTSNHAARGRHSGVRQLRPTRTLCPNVQDIAVRGGKWLDLDLNLELERRRRQRGGCRPLVRSCGCCATWQQDCKISGKQDGILHLPKLRAKMQRRFRWVAGYYPQMKKVYTTAGIGASCFLLSFLYLSARQGAKHTVLPCRPAVSDPAH